MIKIFSLSQLSNSQNSIFKNFGIFDAATGGYNCNVTCMMYHCIAVT